MSSRSCKSTLETISSKRLSIVLQNLYLPKKYLPISCPCRSESREMDTSATKDTSGDSTTTTAEERTLATEDLEEHQDGLRIHSCTMLEVSNNFNVI